MAGMRVQRTTAPDREGSTNRRRQAGGSPVRRFGRAALRWLAAPLVVGLLAGGLTQLAVEPSYQAVARMRLEGRSPEAARGQFQVITSREFARQVVERSGLVEKLSQPSWWASLRLFTPALAATEVGTERALRNVENNLALATPLDGRAAVSFTAHDPRLAADVANAFADSYVELRRVFSDQSAPTLSVFHAVPPRQAMGLSPLQWGLGAGAAGFAFTLLLQALWRRRPISEPAEPVAVLMPEPVPQPAPQHLPWIGSRADEDDEEQVLEPRRRARRDGELADLSRLVRLRGAAARLVVVTGPTADEGTALCALALGRSLAASEKRVVIVCLDVTADALAELTSDPRSPGLTDLLFGVASFSDAIHRDARSHCHVIPPGRGARDADGLVAADRLGLILRALEQTYDHVVVAAPPLGDLAESATIAALGPTAILVTHPGALATDAVQAFDGLAARGFSDIAMVTFTDTPGSELSHAA